MRIKRKKLLALLLSAAMVLSQPVMSAFADEVKTGPVAEVTEDTAEAKVLKDDEDKAKMTLMLYIVGSDLERNSFLANQDLIEILAGMRAANYNFGDIPVNIIAETGGISYNWNYTDSKDTTRTDKVYYRANSRYDMQDPNSTLFKFYNKETENLANDENFTFDAGKYFKDLTKEDKEAPDQKKFADEYPGERINWEKNQRWELSYADVDETHPCITTAVNAGNEDLSMVWANEDGVTTELYDFVYDTMRDYPADRYALILWDHGGGAVDGFGSDERDLGEEESTERKAITSYNIKKTFDALKKELGDKWQNFAFAGYDACLMGDIDTISAWEDYTDYLAVSEDLEPGQGWYYTPAIYELCACAASKDPEATFDFSDKNHMEAISERIGETLVSSYTEWFRKVNDRATLGFFDLRDDSDGLKNLKEAVNDFSGALTDYIKEEPAEAYPALYNAHNDGVVFFDNAVEDLRMFSDNVSSYLGSYDPEKDDVRNKAIGSAIDLFNVIDNAKEDKKGPTISQNNTGVYEGAQVYEHGGSEMGGISWFSPNGSNSNTNWLNYRDLYIDELGEETNNYHDLTGAYVAIQYSCKDAMDKLFTGELTEEEGIKSLQTSMNEALKEYGVSDDVKEALKDSAAAFVKKRIRPEDATVVQGEDGKWYSKIENLDFADRFINSAYIYYAENDCITLGELPGTNLSDEGDIIIGDPDAKDWIYFGDGKYTYPAYVYDSTVYGSDDAMNGELYIKIPAVIVGEGDGVQKNCLMNVHFESGKETGEIESYQIFDFHDPFSKTNRTTNKASFTGEEYVTPLYNCDTEAMAPGDKDGNTLLKTVRLKDAKFTRGAQPEGLLTDMEKSLAKWDLAPEDGLNLKLDVSFAIKDVFGNFFGIAKEEAEEEEEETEPLSKTITKDDIAIIEGDAPSVSKNEILSKIDEAIDSMVKEKKTVSFNSIKGSGKNAGKEYQVQISMNRALRYDGRNHAFNSNDKGSKSKNQDIEIKVLYNEGGTGWKEAKVKKAVIKNAKNALFDYTGNKLGSVKGYSKAPYLSSIVLEDKELNKALGKALNKELKELSKKLKSDKSSSYKDGDLEDPKANMEKKLIIPVYPLFTGVSGNRAKYTDGNLRYNDVTIYRGSFDSGKKKLKDAKVSIQYSDGLGKDIKLKYNSKKDKDFKHEVKEVKAADGSTKTQLMATGNFFGVMEY